MTEKKNDDYEKPESHGEDEDLENVSGGEVGKWTPWCAKGNVPVVACVSGNKDAWYCSKGSNGRFD